MKFHSSKLSAGLQTMREWLEKNEEKLNKNEKITAVFLIYVRKIYSRIRISFSKKHYQVDNNHKSIQH